MSKIIFILFGCIVLNHVIAQQNVAINATGNAPDASAQLDVSSTSKGLLIPRMSGGQRMAIMNPAQGLLVYDWETMSFWVHNGMTWNNLAASTTSWIMNGNSGTNPATNYIGTNDNVDLRFKINSVNAGLLGNNGNTFWGLRSGNSNTTGRSNIAIGIDALKINSTTSNLVAIGDSALLNNAGGFNVAVGSKSLFANTTGGYNTAHGSRSLYSNTFGNYNTATGFQALHLNTLGSWNAAYGLE